MKKRIAFKTLDYAWGYVMWHPWLIVKHYWRQLKYFIQRGLYGYADEDWWDLDSYLATFLPAALRQIGNGYSYPGLGAADTHEKWSAICEKMAKGFEAHRVISEDWPQGDELVALRKVEKAGFKLFIEWFDHLWD